MAKKKKAGGISEETAKRRNLKMAAAASIGVISVQYQRHGISGMAAKPS